MGQRVGGGRHRRVRFTTAVGTRLIPAIPFFEDELRLLPTLVPPGGTCLDVGAAHGIYTVAMAAAVGPTGRVVAFEPQPLPRRVAVSVHTALGLRNVVQLQRIALGDRTAQDVLVVPYRGRMPISGRAFLDQEGQQGHRDQGPPDGEDLTEFTGSRRIAVRTRPLDAVVEELGLERIDLIKIDVEGAELRTLAGAEHTLSTCKPALIVEIESRHTARYGHPAESVFGWLAHRGYRALVYERGRLRPADGVVDGARNYLFIGGSHPARAGSAA